MSRKNSQTVPRRRHSPSTFTCATRGATTIFGNRLDRNAADGRARGRPDFRYVLGQEATAVAMADSCALNGRPDLSIFMRRRARQRHGRAGRPKASETPLVVTAGQQDTRHLFSDPGLRRFRRRSGKPRDQMGDGGAGAARTMSAMALRRAFAIAATPPQACSLSLPMDIPGAGGRGAFVPRVAARGAPSPTLAISPGCSSLCDPARVAVLIGDVPPAAAGRRGRAGACRRLCRLWRAAHLARRVPSHDPCWGGMLKPDFAAIREKSSADVEAALMIGGRAFVALSPIGSEATDPREGELPCRRFAHGGDRAQFRRTMR